MLKRIRRLPSPASVISAIALVLAVGGGSAALALSDTHKDRQIAKDVANNQITRRAPHLSVRHARTATRAASASTIGGSLRGVAVAGARVTENGSLLGYFSRSGGAPTVTRDATGAYSIIFPGNSVDVNQQVVLGSLNAAPGEIQVDSLNGTLIVHTTDTVGNPADRPFAVIVFPASTAG